MSFHESLQPYIDELEIENPIEYSVRHGAIASIFDSEEGVHRVVHHDRVRASDLEEFASNRPFLGNFVHELCHLHLAEKISPSFSGLTYEGTVAEGDQLSVIDNSVVDIWVNDLFSERFPELFKVHHKAYADTSAKFIRTKDWRLLLPPAIPHTLAHSEADAKRHDLEQPDFVTLLQKAGFDKKQLSSGAGRSLHGMFDTETVRQFGFKTIDKLYDHLRQQTGEQEPRTISDIALLRDFMADVPRISYDHAEAIKIHQEVVQRYSQIGRFTIQPKLVDEMPRPCWYFE